MLRRTKGRPRSNKLKHSFQPDTLCFFSDEKIFCQDQIVNLQNNCLLALSSQDILILIKTNHPVHIMVFGLVISIGDIMPLFISLDLRFNTETYKCLGEIDLTWIYIVAAGGPYICEEMSVTTLLLVPGGLTLQIIIPILFISGVRSSGRLTKFCTIQKLN